MAGSLGTLLYQIKAQNSDFKGKMDENKSKVREFDQAAERNRRNLRRWGIAIAAIGTAILGLGWNFAQAASDAEEAQNRFDVVFGELSGEANQWADEFIDTFSQSRTEIRTMMATLQDTLVPMGMATDQAFELTAQMTELSADISSFANVPIAQAMNDMQSAIVGNHRTMRKYGVIINETRLQQIAYERGIANVGEELTELEKIQARTILIMEGMEKAQGDYLRTQHTLANKTREFRSAVKNLREEIGEHLVPTVGAGVTGAKALLDIFSNMPEEIQKTITQTTFFAGAAAAIVGPMMALVSVLPRVSAGLAAMGTGFAPFLIGGAVLMGLGMIVTRMQEIKREAELAVLEIENVFDITQLQRQLEAVENELDRFENRRMSVMGMPVTDEEGDPLTGMLNEEQLENYNLLIERRAEILERIEKIEADEIEIPGADVDTGESEVSAMAEEINDFIESVQDRLDYLNFEENVVQDITVPDLLNRYEAILDEVREKRREFQSQMSADATEEEQKRLEELVQMEDDVRLDILRKEYQQARDIQSLRENLADNKAELEMDALEYSIYRLDQEEREIKMSFREQLGDTEEFHEARLEIEEVYNGLRERERRRHNERIEQMERSFRERLQMHKAEGLEAELLDLDQRYQAEVRQAMESGADITDLTRLYAAERAEIISEYRAGEREEAERTAAEIERVERELTNAIKELKSDELELELMRLDERRDEYLKTAEDELLVWTWYYAEREALLEGHIERRRRAEDELKSNMHEMNEISDAEYRQYLERRLSHYEQFSNDWMRIYRAMQRLEGESQEVLDSWLISILENAGYKVDELEGKFNRMRDEMVRGFMDMISGAQTFQEALTGILDSLADLIVQRGIVEPMVDKMLSLGSGDGGGFGILDSLFNFATAHSGGLITNAGVINDLPEYHSGGKIPGLKSDEVIIKALTGERVLSRDQNKSFEGSMKSNAGSGGGSDHFTININAIDPASFSEIVQRNPEAVIGVVAKDVLGNGQIRDLIKNER